MHLCVLRFYFFPADVKLKGQNQGPPPSEQRQQRCFPWLFCLHTPLCVILNRSLQQLDAPNLCQRQRLGAKAKVP